MSGLPPDTFFAVSLSLFPPPLLLKESTRLALDFSVAGDRLPACNSFTSLAPEVIASLAFDFFHTCCHMLSPSPLLHAAWQAVAFNECTALELLSAAAAASRQLSLSLSLSLQPFLATYSRLIVSGPISRCEQRRPPEPTADEFLLRPPLPAPPPLSPDFLSYPSLMLMLLLLPLPPPPSLFHSLALPLSLSLLPLLIPESDAMMPTLEYICLANRSTIRTMTTAEQTLRRSSRQTDPS